MKVKQDRNSKRVSSFTGSVEERFRAALAITITGVTMGWESSKPKSRVKFQRRFRDGIAGIESTLEFIQISNAKRKEIVDEAGDLRRGDKVATFIYSVFSVIRANKPELPAIPRFEEKLSSFMETLQLTKIECDIMRLSTLISVEELRLQQTASACASMSRLEMASAVAILLGHDRDEVKKALQENGSIARFGLLENIRDAREYDLDDWIKLDSSLRNWLLSSNKDVDFPIGSGQFQGDIPCTIDDYPHLALQANLAAKLLRKGRTENVPGVNILLVGKPGTGKTVLTRALARHLGFSLFEVASQDDSAEALDAEDRLKAYMRSQRALSSKPDSILLFDEAEDIVGQKMDGPFSFLIPRQSIRNTKSFANRMLEENPVPTLWTTNSTDCMDDAWLRRFSLIVEVPIPSISTRKQMVDLQIPQNSISSEMRDALARTKKLSAGHLASIAKTLKLAEPQTEAEADTICKTALAAPLRILTKSPNLAGESRYAEYDPAFLNLNGGDAEGILRAVRAKGSGRFLLSGPPGSGKTGLAHYISQQLGRELICKTASSLLDCYVGNTEKNIAAMFEEARQEDAVLLLDEADSFFLDRAGASKNWEVTQVNELLARMEDYNGIFFCSTNFSDRFDPAAMRRFLFKVKFNYLTPSQAMALTARVMPEVDWNAHENTAVRDAIADHRLLTPADFFNVKSRLDALGEPLAPRRFAEELQLELASKRETDERRMGFRGR